MSVFPGPQLVETVNADEEELMVDIHPAYGDLSYEEEVATVQPEAPVTLQQVQTWFRYQASPSERRTVLSEFAGDSRPSVRTHNRRIQADFRPLMRDQAQQVQVQPHVTRLPSGGIAVEGPNFSFRCDQQITEGQLELEED